MENRTYTTLEAAIEGGKEMAVAKDAASEQSSWDAFFSMPCSLFKAEGNYIVLQQSHPLELDAETYAATGEWLGVVDAFGFTTREEIRAEQKRVAEIESRGQ